MAVDNPAPFVSRLVDPTAGEIEDLINLLLKAFDGDTAMQSLSGRNRTVESLMYRLILQQALLNGECLVARSPHSPSEICGVAAWLAPGTDWDFHNDPSFLSMLDPILKEWYNAHYASKYNELRTSTGIPRKDKGAWVLKLLAVVPDSRRKGIGKALVDDVCKKADINHEALVADVRDPSIVHFFQRSGFKYRCVKNVMSPGSPGFPIWRMSREPPSAPALA